MALSQDIPPQFFAYLYSPAALFFWGACWASFFNVVLYRYPLGRSVVWPGSACPSCGKDIAWFDNIPVLSWLILRGRCRHCRAPIAFRYAVVEFLGGLLWLAVWWAFPEQPALGILCGLLISAGLALAVCFTLFRKAPWYLWMVALTAILALSQLPALQK
jgi:leader peptidase (prepilin peptidase)/N-methyltransferase